MTRRWLHVGCAVAMTGALSGCGSDDEGSTTPENTSVEIFSWWTKGGEAQALQVVLDAHKAAFPRVEVVNTAVVTETAGGKARDELAKRMNEKNPPDAFQQTGALATWLTAGDGIRELDTLAATKGWSTAISPFLLPGVELQQKLYAVPTNVHSQNYLFYNKQVLTANGVAPPTSIAELQAACTTLKAAGVTPLAMSYQGWIMRITFDAVAVATAANGAQFLKNLYAGTTDQATLQSSVENFDTLVKNCSKDASPTVEWDALANQLAAGTTAMYIHGDWLKGQLDSQGKTPGTDYDVVLFPGGANGTSFLFNADSFALPNKAKNPTGAEDFLGTFLKPEVQATFAKTKGACPSVKGVDLSAFDSVAKSICDGMAKAMTPLLVEEKIDTVLQEAYVGGKTTAEIVAAITAAYPAS